MIDLGYPFKAENYVWVINQTGGTWASTVQPSCASNFYPGNTQEDRKEAAYEIMLDLRQHSLKYTQCWYKDKTDEFPAPDLPLLADD